MSDSLRTAPRPINREAVARAMRPMSQGDRVNAMGNDGLSGLLTNYLSDSLSGIKRVPGLIENLLNQSPEKIARGVLGPAYTSTTQAPLAANFVGPQADIKGMVEDSSKVIPNLREGKYFDAAGNFALAAAAIPMMAVPGTVAGLKKGVNNLIGHNGGPINKGMDVPYTKLKLSKDQIDAFDKGRLYTPSDQYVTKRTIEPSDLQGGYLTNLYGDRSDIGMLHGVSGRKFDTPVVLDGGHGYMRGEGQGAWASHPTVVKKISNKVRSVADEGKPIFGGYVPMSGEATDFAVKTLSTAFNGFDPKALPKKDIKLFNETMKKIDKTFPSIGSEEFYQWASKSGANRYNLMKVLAKSKWREKGFPDIAEARHAIQDPNLRLLPDGNEAMGGQSFSLLDPRGVQTPVQNLKMPHTTYQMDLAGKYMGGLQNPVPRSIMFPDWFDTRRQMSSPISSDNKSFLSNNLLQPTDQKWVDTISKFLEGQGK